MPRPKRTKITRTQPPTSQVATTDHAPTEATAKRNEELNEHTVSKNRRRSSRTNVTQDESQTAPQEPVRATSRTVTRNPTYVRRISHVRSTPRAGNTPSAQRIGTTPSLDTSMISLANFKRRPRQPSILRMVQKSLAPEDLESAESSLAMDDESALLGHYDSTIATPQDNRVAPRQSSGSMPSTRSRKRKLVDMQERPVSLLPPSSPASRSEASVSDIPSDPIELPELDAARQTERPKTPEQEPPSETMASPLSSSPAPNPSEQQRVKPAVKKRSIYVEPSSPPTSEEDSRPRRTRGSSKPTQDPKTVTTARLQTLMPRRRIVRPSPFHILADDEEAFDETSDHSDDDNDNDNETQHRASHRPRTNQTSRSTLKRNTKAKKNIKATSSKQASKAANNSTRRRRRGSNKENATPGQEDGNVAEEISELPDEDSQLVAPTAELTDAARKFAEIDQWEMEYETVDIGGGAGSSSPRWR